MLARRKLFRTQALKHYVQNKQQDILPGFVTPPVFRCLWFLLLISGITTFFAWQEHVPTYIQAPGVVLMQGGEPATALIFVPSSSTTDIVVGQELTLQMNVTGQQFQASVASIDPGITTPDAARAKYALTGDTQFIITQPSVVVHLNVVQQQVNQIIDHVSITAQIQVGSRSLLSLLPGLLGNAFGG